MKIFYAGVQHNFYDPRKGLSFEHQNLYVGLQAMKGVEVTYFPFERILEVGKEKWNEELLERIQAERPDLLFVFAVSDEFDPEILDEIKKHTTSIVWFADDSWRFWNYSRFWAPHFTWAVTTYSWMPALYRKYGQLNVIRSQWAANTVLYKPSPADPDKPDPNVTFVGGWSRPRAKIVDGLARAGVPIELYGGGWPHARRAGDAELVWLFGRSRINLALNPAPGFWNLNSLGRVLGRRTVDRGGYRFRPDWNLSANVQSWLCRGIPQIKARHFEIPACGGFTIAGMADDLQAFYEPGREIAVYEDIPDLIRKVRYYLEHEEERAEIARRGYERTVREHTYEHRFRDIFRAAGLA